nr:transposase (putative), gypsy type [Tanacetum cinerariifolium]
MSFSKRPGKNTPQCYTKPLDSLKNWNNRFFWVDERVFPTVVDWRTNAPKDGMPAAGTYSVEAVRALDTHRTPIQKQPEMLLCLVGLSRRYYLGDEVYPTFLYDNDRDMDLFSLIRAPNPTKRSPLDFSLDAGASDQGIAASEVPPSGDVPTTAAPEPSQGGVAAADPPAATESGKRGRDGTDANAPPKSLRRDHADPRPSGSSHGGKSLAAIQLGLASTASLPEDAPTSVSDPDPLCFADPPARPSADVAQSSPGIAAAGDPESENASSPTEVGSSGGVYQPEWGVTMVAYLTPLRPVKTWWTISASGNGVTVAPQVQTRGQAAEEIRGPGGSPNKRIQARELEIKKVEALLETEADMKKAAEDKSAGLIKELEDMRARFSDLQVSHEHLSQLVASLKEQISGEEKLKAAFEEFKHYEDDRVERRCAELDARLNELSIDFDEELYPHMLTAIAGRRWVIGHGLRLAVMKCSESLDTRQAFADVVSARIAKGMSEGLRHGVEHGQAQRNVESIEAYDPEAEAKFVVALQALKDLKYPLLDQLEGLKDAPIDVIMAALYLESDTGEDAPQCIRDLRPSSF